MSEQSLQLVHEFTYQVACGPPHEVGAGPYGGRQYFEMTGGRVEGPRLKGKLLGAGSDWMLTGPDGFMRMDVRVQIETDDGAILCAHYFGPAEANEKLKRAVTACAPTEFADQSIRSYWVLETGDLRYAWVNQTVFVGQGPVAPRWPRSAGLRAPGLPTILNQSVSNSRRPPRGYQGATPWWTPSTQARQEANGLEGV